MSQPILPSDWFLTTINTSLPNDGIIDLHHLVEFLSLSLHQFCCVSSTFKKPNMSQSDKMSFQAGEAKGEAKEKGNQMMEKVSNAAQSTKETCQEAGQQIKSMAQGAADAVKNATGMNK